MVFHLTVAHCEIGVNGLMFKGGGGYITIKMKGKKWKEGGGGGRFV